MSDFMQRATEGTFGDWVSEGKSEKQFCAICNEEMKSTGGVDDDDSSCSMYDPADFGIGASDVVCHFGCGRAAGFNWHDTLVEALRTLGITKDEWSTFMDTRKGK